MNKVRSCLNHILLAAALSTSLATVATAGALEDEVLASQGARLRAMIDEDVDALSDLLADDLHYSHTRGSVESKAQFLSTIQSKRIDYLVATPKDVKVRLFGETAVITGLSDMKLIYLGEQFDFTIRFLEVSHKVNTNWQLVAWQSVRYDPD
ncbi:MAG: nuclear transport factor 2 family protein [Woeseiaceae bacterium]